MTITTNDTTSTRLNPNATLAMCERCGEHAPRFVCGTGVLMVRLCPSCAVAQNLNELPAIAAEQLQAALIAWITTPNPALDGDDETFYAARSRHAWTQRDLDDEAERQARKAWVASVCPEPGDTQDDRDAAFMADFWAALTGGIAA